VALPDAERGLVFHYDYLWSHEARSGRSTSKERPACLALSSDSETTPQIVVILPITHRKPGAGVVGVEIPRAVRRNLGVDDEPCWVIVSEVNIDDWPNSGIAPLPGSSRIFAYGFLPPGLYETVKKKMLAHYSQSRIVRRER
jgi:hypothetical protein